MAEPTSSPFIKINPSLSQWMIAGFGFACAGIVFLLDLFRPVRLPWSDMYYLVGLYGGLFMRRRAELLLYACLIIGTVSVPLLHWQFHDAHPSRLMHRVTGVICGLVMIGLVRTGRRYVQALQTTNDELEQKVQNRTAELRSSYQRLEVLSRELIRTQEAERRHLARELHDQIGQVLTALKMNLHRAEQSANEQVQPHLQSSVQMADEAIGQVRNLTLSLRPPQLDELGLVAALHWLVQHQGRAGNVDGQLDADLGTTRISPDMELVCFRIAQEALTNAIRHAHPGNLHVKIWAHGQELHLSIKDDGIGFNVTEVRTKALKGQSAGLISMQERASLIGGQLEIESAPESGTRIHAIFPLSAV